ncbi:hypothetical protein [Shouchella patagoniensis]|uniref:hypothetical protein n=1 Tax=Shouchella patagoniensis TaxID=228576 RepID=UPI000995C135|nr:hypothetical protein [Shouchella patagoniensis]
MKFLYEIADDILFLIGFAFIIYTTYTISITIGNYLTGAVFIGAGILVFVSKGGKGVKKDAS